MTDQELRTYINDVLIPAKNKALHEGQHNTKRENRTYWAGKANAFEEVIQDLENVLFMSQVKVEQ